MMHSGEWNDDLGTRTVVTWQAPGGSKINLTATQAEVLREAGVWPRAASGEYCQVSRGLHRGYPTYSSDYIAWCAQHGYNPDDPGAYYDGVTAGRGRPCAGQAS